jgi:hypothetical protein
MDEDLSIINTNTRNERVKNFFLKNKSKIISAAIVLIIIIICVFSYDRYTITKKKEISDKFNSIVIDYSEKTKDKTTTSLIKILNKKDPTYSPLSLYFIIDNNLVSDRDRVNSFFDILINATSLENEIKNLIIYKKALYNADNAQESDLLNILNPLINSKSVWKSHSLYLMAEYFYANNQNEKAKEFYNKIISLEKSNPELKTEAEKRLSRDLSE